MTSCARATEKGFPRDIHNRARERHADHLTACSTNPVPIFDFGVAIIASYVYLPGLIVVIAGRAY